MAGSNPSPLQRTIPMKHQDAVELETLVDRHGLSRIVETLAQIASEKADHIRSSYVDSESLARAWDRDARTLSRAASRVGTPLPPRKSKMQTEVEGMLGDLGISGVRIGCQSLKAAHRDSLKELKGYGVTVRVGSVVELSVYDKTKREWFTRPEPQRIFSLFRGSNGKPLFQYCTFDDGPLCSDRILPLVEELDTEFFRIKFRRLSMEEISAWFEQNRRLDDGEHDLGHSIGKVIIHESKPVTVIRPSPEHSMAYTVELAGQLSGFDLVVSRTYADEAKTMVLVKRAVRRIAADLIK